jgi:hypothetical protein
MQQLHSSASYLCHPDQSGSYNKEKMKLIINEGNYQTLEVVLMMSQSTQKIAP